MDFTIVIFVYSQILSFLNKFSPDSRQSITHLTLQMFEKIEINMQYDISPFQNQRSLETL